MSVTTIPRKIIQLNVAVAQSALGVTTSAFRLVNDGVKNVLDTSRTAGKTVVGQGRSVVERTAATASAGVKEVSGQAEAQGKKVAKVVDKQANRIVDRATDAVEGKPHQGTAYEQWTRAQLLERAKEVEVTGRSAMSKNELIAALRR
ncbi:MAG: hypothetical protein ABIR32_06790 [Ilumatobacteraceae bacterium]